MFDPVAIEIENEYAVLLPMEVKMLLKDYEGQFIQVGDGEHYRILNKDEILNTERHLGLDCLKMGVIPLIDCKDNNFLVYNGRTRSQGAGGSCQGADCNLRLGFIQ